MSEAEPVRRVYLGSLSILVLEASELEGDILAQVLAGFKVRTVTMATDVGDAFAVAQRSAPDMVIAGTARAGMGEADEYDFIRQLRRSRSAELARIPTILLAGHTSRANVIRARDCGASVVVAKPITPAVLYDRLIWLATDARSFVNTKTYVGPDRRFQTLGPPPSTEGRRHDDLSLQVGESQAPNMSQSEIDVFLNAKGAVRL